MLLMMNVDDISGEALPHLIDELHNRGANSVHVVQALTKKGRLEYLFWVDAPEECVEALGGYLAQETGTLGVRVFDPHHIRFDYRVRPAEIEAQGERGDVEARIQVKEVLARDGRVTSVKAECDDLRAALAVLQEKGLEVSFSALKRLVEQAALTDQEQALGPIRVIYPADQEIVTSDVTSHEGVDRA